MRFHFATYFDGYDLPCAHRVSVIGYPDSRCLKGFSFVLGAKAGPFEQDEVYLWLSAQSLAVSWPGPLLDSLYRERSLGHLAAVLLPLGKRFSHLSQVVASSAVMN